MSSKKKKDGSQDSSWPDEEDKYQLLAEQKRRHGERLAKEECEAKMVQENKLFIDNKTKQLFELAKEEAKQQETLQIENECKHQSKNREKQLIFLDEQETRLESLSKEEKYKKASLAEKVKEQELIAKTEFARFHELETQNLEKGEQSKLDKEGRALLLDDEARREEGKNAFLESEKRLRKQKHDNEEKEKVEMERASVELENRFQTTLLVKEHEMEFTKMLDDTHQAKTRDETLKGKRWQDEKVNEDLEMEEKIKARNALQKQKLLEYEKVREETENDAKAIESNIIKMSKEYKEERLEKINIDQFHEEEKRKKEEGVKKREIAEMKRRKIDSEKLEMEQVALAKEKIKRKEVSLKQEAELSRFEQELRRGDDVRTRREMEKMQQIEQQIEQEEKEASDMLQRQKLRKQELVTKKDAIVKEDKNQEDEKVLHEQRKQQENMNRNTAKVLSDERECEEERLRLEGIQRRELQMTQQQEEILKQQDAEMELLMKSRKVKASAVDDVDSQATKTKSEKKRIFGGLFRKRGPKE